MSSRSQTYFEDRALPDRYCDLILTGGVTSAIAYPGTIVALAQAYRFHSIGGSSSGAGAAALAAAAEYRRRQGSPQGYQLLIDRMLELTKVEQGHTRLFWLFQPTLRNEALFNAVAEGFARPRGKVGRIVRGLLLGYAPWWIAGLALPLAVGALQLAGASTTSAYVTGALAGALAVACAVVALLVALHGDLKRLVANDHGLSDARSALPGAPHPPLTVWLHELIQQIAGRPLDEPLTFADLAAAPGSPQGTLGSREAGDALSIRLQMYAANVTHGRPYLFPQSEPGHGRDGDPQLYFRPREMLRLFPKEVVAHLQRHAKAPVQQDGGDALDQLWPLPRMGLPIVVAARMSVSFPVLFSAVPLWAQDPHTGHVRRCLFADGGLCSNFPIHLFDSAVPAWPTFGLALHDLPDPGPHEQREVDEQYERMRGSIRLPTRQADGAHETWHDFDDPAKTPLVRFGGYLAAMFDTIRHWGDATLSRLPGVRDRVVRMGLAPGIGGLNILMTGEQIECLGRLGGDVGKTLLERYALHPDASGAARGWAEHRWVRFHVLRECLTAYLSGLGQAAAGSRHAPPVVEQIRAAVSTPPLGPAGDPDGTLCPTPAEAAELEGALRALVEAERALKAASSSRQPFQPSPLPDLRVHPPL